MEGKRFLDFHTNIASLPLGYNHPKIIEKTSSERFARLSAHRQNLNLYPTWEHLEHLENVYSRIQPFENPYLHLTSSGSEAVETVIKVCNRKLKKKSTVETEPLCVSFDGAFHGRTCGALSLTSTDPSYNAGFPNIPNMKAPFPVHPVTEDGALEGFRRLISRKASRISCVFVEPIQCEGGDRMASPEFWSEIRMMCHGARIPFIVDEIQTGLSTGNIWSHTSWCLKVPPDAVLFSKKFQVSGVFFSSKLAPSTAELYAYNSTWPGDAARSEILDTILDVVESEDLLDKSFRLGTNFFSQLAAVPGVKTTRNIGFMGSFDIDYRDSVIKLLQEEGLLVSGSGVSSIRIRPALIVSAGESEKALGIIRNVLNG